MMVMVMTCVIHNQDLLVCIIKKFSLSMYIRIITPLHVHKLDKSLELF